MLDKALGDDLRHGLGGLILCQLPAARKANRERGYDFAGIGGGQFVAGVGHPSVRFRRVLLRCFKQPAPI